MGLLDDLKKQADALKAQDTDRSEVLRANAAAVDACLRRAFVYLNDLGKQLNVVNMPCPFVFKMPTVGEVPGLVFKDFFADYRTKSVLDNYYYSDVHLAAHCCSDAALNVSKGPEEMAKFRDFLWQNNIEHKSEQLRDQRRVITQEVFAIPCDFRVLAEIAGNHETGALRIGTRNVGGFDADVFHVTAQEFDARAVEEFAKYFIGQPSEWTDLVKRSGIARRVAVNSAPKPKPRAEPTYAVRDEAHRAAEAPAPEEERGLLKSLRSFIKREH